MDKSEKKRLQEEYARKEQERFIASLPMSQALFPELFDYLDENLEKYGCQHTFDLTKNFLTHRGLCDVQILEWMHRQGVGCDCEVLYNLEEYFE